MGSPSSIVPVLSLVAVLLAPSAGLTRPVVSACAVSHPVLAPDGTRMAFLSNATGSYELYLHDRGSGALERLTENEAFEGSVSWAPDSRAFVFWAWFEDDEDFEGYRYERADGTLTRIVESPGHDFDLSWSPDGSRVAFQSERTGDREIYLLELGDGSVRRLTRNPAEDLTPSWSPDGRSLAFASDRVGGVRQIHTLDLESGAVTRLPAQPEGANTFPLWNAAGNAMLVTSERADGGHELYRIDMANGTVERIASEVSSGPASWAPDDRGVLFSEIVGEGSRIVERAADGSRVVVDCAAVRRVTNPPAGSPAGAGPVR